jgi:hypothetical protein
MSNSTQISSRERDEVRTLINNLLPSLGISPDFYYLVNRAISEAEDRTYEEEYQTTLLLEWEARCDLESCLGV